MVYQKTKSILNDQGLAPSKKLGQNFLVHRHTAERIVELAHISHEDTVIEVGVGLGALTGPLAEQSKNVIGIEADSGIIRMHMEQGKLPQNVELVHEDILKTDLKALTVASGGRLKIVANLPYSISTPFIFRLIDNSDLIDFAVVMLQKEVAMRLIAEPNTKEYGIPSVLLASCGTAQALMQVKPAEFHPRPKVDSTVIKLSFHPVPERVKLAGAFNYKILKQIVSLGFGQRRKTLLNTLSKKELIEDKQVLGPLIEKAGLQSGVRAEKLTFEQFVTLTRVLTPYV